MRSGSASENDYLVTGGSQNSHNVGAPIALPRFREADRLSGESNRCDASPTCSARVGGYTSIGRLLLVSGGNAPPGIPMCEKTDIPTNDKDEYPTVLSGVFGRSQCGDIIAESTSDIPPDEENAKMAACQTSASTIGRTLDSASSKISGWSGWNTCVAEENASASGSQCVDRPAVTIPSVPDPQFYITGDVTPRGPFSPTAIAR